MTFPVDQFRILIGLLAVIFCQYCTFVPTSVVADESGFEFEWQQMLSRHQARWTIQSDGAADTALPEGSGLERMAVFRAPAVETGAAIYRILVVIAQHDERTWQVLDAVLRNLALRDLPLEMRLLALAVPTDQSVPPRDPSQFIVAQANGVDLVTAIGSRASGFLKQIEHTVTVPKVATSQIVSAEGGSDNLSGFGTLGPMYFAPDSLPLGVVLRQLRRIWPGLDSAILLYERQDAEAIRQFIRPTLAAARADGQFRVILLPIDINGDEASQIEQGILRARETLRRNRIRSQKGQTVIWTANGPALTKHLHRARAAAGSVPLISHHLSLVRERDAGVVLAVGIHPRTNGKLAAMQIVRLLNNKRVPFHFTFGGYTIPDLAVDFRLARQMGLKLPFSVFEQAGDIIAPQGHRVLRNGLNVR